MGNRTASDYRATCLGGTLSGIIAGIAMAMFAMGYAMWMGDSAFMPLRMIAATLYGEAAATGGPAVLLVGLMIHMCVSAAFGGIFAYFLQPNWSAAPALAAGLVYGVAIWALMGWVVVPVVNRMMADALPKMQGAFFAEHLIFGGVLLITPALVRRFTATTGEVQRERLPRAA